MFFRSRKRLKQQYIHLFPVAENNGLSENVPEPEQSPFEQIRVEAKQALEGFPSSEWIGVPLSATVMNFEEGQLHNGYYYFCISEKFRAVNFNYPIPVLVFDLLTNLTGTILAIPVFPRSSYLQDVAIVYGGSTSGWLVPNRARLVRPQDCYFPSLRAATSDELLRATTQLRSIDRSMAIGHFAKDHRTAEAMAIELLCSEKPFGEAIRRAWISQQ